ncbi:chromosome segregation protein [Carpediemonas membranifera]|uniref:Chromosome segregation protein n=1 Tax=Carpediemonas membranifera TaxID=201153 RepID=A0A8J6AZ21_9EUKA|nr:chromosome segregation protein [Carpediemonas membranifera]|eukprot:KAG9390754.1 chromosome segregation protein [Carpediemonas membranifera]
MSFDATASSSLEKAIEALTGLKSFVEGAIQKRIETSAEEISAEMPTLMRTAALLTANVHETRSEYKLEKEKLKQAAKASMATKSLLRQSVSSQQVEFAFIQQYSKDIIAIKEKIREAWVPITVSCLLPESTDMPEPDIKQLRDSMVAIYTSRVRKQMEYEKALLKEIEQGKTAMAIHTRRQDDIETELEVIRRQRDEYQKLEGTIARVKRDLSEAVAKCIDTHAIRTLPNAQIVSIATLPTQLKIVMTTITRALQSRGVAVGVVVGHHALALDGKTLQLRLPHGTYSFAVFRPSDHWPGYPEDARAPVVVRADPRALTSVAFRPDLAEFSFPEPMKGAHGQVSPSLVMDALGVPHRWVDRLVGGAGLRTKAQRKAVSEICEMLSNPPGCLAEVTNFDKDMTEARPLFEWLPQPEIKCKNVSFLEKNETLRSRQMVYSVIITYDNVMIKGYVYTPLVNERPYVNFVKVQGSVPYRLTRLGNAIAQCASLWAHGRGCDCTTLPGRLAYAKDLARYMATAIHIVHASTVLISGRDTTPDLVALSCLGSFTGRGMSWWRGREAMPPLVVALDEGHPRLSHDLTEFGCETGDTVM